MRTLCLLLLLVSPLAGLAADVVIDGPAGPVAVADLVTLSVVGIPEADLPRAVVSVAPASGVQLRAVRSWANTPELLFVAKTPGSYRVTVAVNGWREPITAGLTAAKAAAIAARAQIDGRYAVQIDSLAAELVQAYPITSASCVVEVAGQNPTPPGPPPPPPPPVTSAVRALILFDSSQPAEERGLQLNLLRNDPTWSRKIEILDSRTENEHGQPSALVANALRHLAGRPLPRLLGIDASGAFVFDVELPQSAALIKAAMAEKGMTP